MIGYTPSQARALKHAIDRDMAAVEDRLTKMRQRVTDTGLSGFTNMTEVERLREFAGELKAIVDRRTSSAAVPESSEQGREADRREWRENRAG